MYLAVLVGAVLLFMLAAAALPNPAGGEESVDLRTHYERVRRRFWIVFTIHYAVNVATSLWLQMAIHHDYVLPWYAWLVWLMVPVSVSLAVFRSRIWHSVALGALCLVYLVQFWGHTLPS
jgi:Na+/melibiose symporter-like transporter